ncbi:hypothetical protein [Nonomuraea sp. NPDC050643]|uniref:hypothetical protein n=1 Tax=Nonomuraea sp. NPDC050643 TaxID=3155660 RepID=UPI0033E751C4
MIPRTKKHNKLSHAFILALAVIASATGSALGSPHQAAANDVGALECPAPAQQGFGADHALRPTDPNRHPLDESHPDQIRLDIRCCQTPDSTKHKKALVICGNRNIVFGLP